MEERGLTISVYPAACGLAFIFGWSPAFVRIMLGPLYVEWIF